MDGSFCVEKNGGGVLLVCGFSSRVRVGVRVAGWLMPLLYLSLHKYGCWWGLHR